MSRTKLTQLEIAEHLSMSERNVRSVLKKIGIDHRSASLDEIRVGYIRMLREEAAGRGGAEQYDLTRARARQAEADAQLKELQFHERVGSLVEADWVSELISDHAISTRNEIDQAIDRLFLSIENEHGIRIDRTTADRALADAYRTIQDHPKIVDEEVGEGA